MKKLISVLLLLSLLITCIPIGGMAADLALQTPIINVSHYKTESGIPVVYSGQPLYVFFDVKDENGNWPNYNNIAVKYTVTRDADGADVTVIPKANAIERTTSLNDWWYITDGKKMTPGNYTIKAKVICTYKGYKDSTEATQKVIVSTESEKERICKFEITNGKSEEYELPQFRIGEKIIATINAPDAVACEVRFEGTYYPVTLTNGVGTFTSNFITTGAYGELEAYLTFADSYHMFSYAYYDVAMAPFTMAFDKKAYSIGETAKMTLTCEDAEYFRVRMRYKEKKEDQDDEYQTDMTNGINYLPVAGTTVIEIPLTESGFLYVSADAYNDTASLSWYESKTIQVDNPENIKYVGEKETKKVASELLPPTGLTIVPGVSGGLTLSWNAAADATDYDVYFTTSDTNTFKLLATVHGTTYTDLAVPAKKLVYYRVVSKRMTADGRWEDTADPLEAPFKSYMLLAKSKLKVRADIPKTLSLSWKKVKDADYYEVYYSTKQDAPTAATKPILTVKDGLSVYATKKVKGGKTYYCYVRGVKQLSDGTKVVGPWSKVVKKKAKK